MNERIKELYEQAGIQFPNNLVEGVNGPGVVSPKDKLAKFALLIVRECYLWAKENGGLGCEEDFEALKEHLGVE
jgi:hypothetical protein